MIRRDPKNHHENCYFCLVDVNHITSNNHNKWIYPDLPFTEIPTLLCSTVQEPVPPVLQSTSAAASSRIGTDNIIDEDKSNNPDFIPNVPINEHFDQNKLNDLIRDLHLTKEHSELLACRLKKYKYEHPILKSRYTVREKQIFFFTVN